MSYIYMDESGDLGFNDKEWASKYFIITFLISKNEKDPEIVMKNVRKWFLWKKVKIKWTFFHSNKESKQAVKRALDLASRRDFRIVAAIIDKSRIFWKSFDTHIVYNSIVIKLLEQCEKRWYLNSNDYYYFIASRKETNKVLNETFKKDLKHAISDLIKMEISVVLPWMSKWLELVDSVSFAVYQKYEYWDLELYSIIKNKIILEKQIF
jgi:hypothetical protein